MLRQLLIPVCLSWTVFSGCAGTVVQTDPNDGIKYSGFDGKYVQADVSGDSQKLLDVAQTVLKQHGFETTRDGQTIDGQSGLNGAEVRIGRSDSGKTHVEVAATEGKLCSNTDYAGLILQDIVQAK
jgi:hypothetical protein